jgi:hypothetical protein
MYKESSTSLTMLNKQHTSTKLNYHFTLFLHPLHQEIPPLQDLPGVHNLLQNQR